MSAAVGDSAVAPLADDSDPTYTHFAHRAEFLVLLERFLQIDIAPPCSDKEGEAEEALVTSLGSLLDHYLPLPGLLDPSLHEIVCPLMEVLGRTLSRIVEDDKNHAHEQITDVGRLARLAKLLNWIVKVRGWKAVVPHFPSGIQHLPILVTLLSPPTAPSTSTSPITTQHPLASAPDTWELRAILLLWLALLLTMPFNLAALSGTLPPSSSTQFGIDQPSAALLFNVPMSDLAQRVALLAIPLLPRPGKEGAFSALVLARLYSREDAVQGLQGFFDWANAEVSDGEREGESHLIASIFELLALLPPMLKATHLSPLESYMEERLLPHLRGSMTAAGSGLIRKLAIKAKGRLWLAKAGKGWASQNDDEAEELDLPEGLEDVLDELMGGLSDKDTIVRYSSAKYLARLSALLPPAFSSQIVQATISLFSGTEDDPVILSPFGSVIDPGGSPSSGGTMSFGGLETSRGEARWHGVCLALAEMARRGSISGDAIGEAVEWVCKALTFDLRRASHSIGANVRDAAAYLLWSLSRACPPEVLEPYAESMATVLICVAVFDREVGVRRAASAAFQEGVGRLGLYPEGIDVLAKTDFYSVSVRRMAFTIAAPAVAVHRVYRDQMREHLHHTTLRHWDGAMRAQGAHALNELLKLGSANDIQDSLDRELGELVSLDAINVHGALMALTQIAILLQRADPRRKTIFEALSTIRSAAFVSTQIADIFSAICDLLVAVLNSDVLNMPDLSTMDRLIDMSMKRREPEVHESLADVFGKLSTLRDPGRDVNRLMSDLRTSRVAQRQAATLALGHVVYPFSPSSAASRAVDALLGILADRTKIDVESRRYAARSLGDILEQRVDRQMIVSPEQFEAVLLALLQGLEDYTTDQRGDVGSWVRATCCSSLGRAVSLNDKRAGLITIELFDSIVGGLIKQAAEKLESVRSEAALALVLMKDDGWEWQGCEGLHVSLEQLRSDGLRHVSQEDWFQSLVPLISGRYMPDLLAGLVHSIGSQVVTLSNAAFGPLLDHITSHLELLQPVLSQLLALLEKHYTSNRNFVPTLQSIHKLLSEGNTEIESDSGTGVGVDQVCLKTITISCKGLTTIKSIERITSSMRVVIACLASSSPVVRAKAVDSLPIFLGHRFPRIRAMASEEVYLALSGMEDELEEELEEVLTGTDWVGQDYQDQVKQVVEMLQSMAVS
ncbi:hypothetical protein IAU60_000583 [Kwoniella sp. DSM 27419]